MSANPISDDWLTKQCMSIAARAGAVPTRRRRFFIEHEISNLGVSLECQLAIQNLLDVTRVAAEENLQQDSKRTEMWMAFGFGLLFLMIILVAAFKFPNPTAFQFFVFRVTLSLAAGGVGGVLTGFINLELTYGRKTWLRAGGALAVFVLVYLVNPAKLITP